MRGGSGPGKRKGETGAGLGSKGFSPAASDLDRRFRLALLLYAVLAVLVWFTMSEGKVLVLGRPVEVRCLPLIVLGGLALRTVIARHAEQIRRSRDGEKDSS